MEEKKETFTYTYSARQREEIERIRKKYLPREEDKMEQLRRLDRGVTRPGMITALTVGIIGALFLGVGMCCTMVWTGAWFVPGVVIGVAGIACVGSAYPLYTHITAKQREKLAPQILKLTEELSQQK